MDELKPCPFCGGQPEVTTKYEPSDDGDDWEWTFIECPMHRVITGADTWNTRPTEDAQAAEIERLQHAVKLGWAEVIDSRDGFGLSDAEALGLVDEYMGAVYWRDLFMDAAREILFPEEGGEG